MSSSTIDQQFVEYIVKSLVRNPNSVKIERRIDEKGVLLELTVDPEDLGRVIGKRGATAQSLRTLLRALGTKPDARYNLKIVDPSGGSGPSRSYDDNHDSHDRREDNYSSRNDEATPKDEEDTSSSEEVEKPEEPKEEEAPEETEHNDRLTQARKELADLDDLDV